MLPNYLADIKSSGFYRFVWDKSEIPGQPAGVLRLVVGYSEKGPFNTPVLVSSESEFKQIFGGRSKKLERYGIWFHRNAIQALKAGPIIALNVKNFENPFKEGTDEYTKFEEAGYNKVEYTSFNPNDTIFLTDETGKIIDERLKMTIKDLYNTDRFWKLEPEKLEELELDGILPTTRKQGYITITSTDTKDTSVSIFLRGYEPKGYDVPIAEWYSAVLNGEEVPTYLEGHERDLVSQFFVEMYIFKGEFTPEIAASDKLAKFFNVNGKEVTLKPYITNAFGEKIDTLSALAQNDASNFVKSYVGILLPEFRNANNTVISIDAQVNADNYIHKLMMRLSQDMLYSIDPDDPESFQISDIDTTGWYKGPVQDEQYRPMSLSKTEPKVFIATFADGNWNYNTQGHDGETADFYRYDDLTPSSMDEYEMTFDKDDSRFGKTGIREGDSIYIQPTAEDDPSTEEDESTGMLAHIVKIEETPVEHEAIIGHDEYWTVNGEGEYPEEPTITRIDVPAEEPTEEYWTIGDVTYDHEPVIVEVPAVPAQEAVPATYTFNTFNYNGTVVTATGKMQVVEDHSSDTTNPSITLTVTEVDVISGGAPCNVGDTITINNTGSLPNNVENFLNESNYRPRVGGINQTVDWVNTEYEPAKEATEGHDAYWTIDGEGEYAEEPVVVHVPASEGHDAYTYWMVNGEGNYSEEPTVGYVEATEGRDAFTSITYTVSLDKPVMEGTIYKCVSSVTYTSDGLKPLYIKGYEYGYSKPESTRMEDKLTWQHYILDSLTNYKGIRQALTNRVDIAYRYLVDTFEGFPEANCKGRLAMICKGKDNAFGILNFPAMKSFSKCKQTSFRNEKNEFDTKYIAMGGNPLKPMSFMFTLPSQEDGASWVGFFTPVNIRDVDTGIVSTVPSAALVSNNFMKKFTKYLPYTIIAGTNRGVLSEQGLEGPDFNFSREDLDNLEPFGVNCMVYIDRKGTVINSNQTAKQNPVTTLSKINVRELCIFLQDEIEKLLEDYHWDFNTPSLQQRIKDRADVILETCKNNHGIYKYYNQCDEFNNTDDVINNELFVLSTSIEPGMGAGKMVQELTIYRKGGMRSAIRLDS